MESSLGRMASCTTTLVPHLDVTLVWEVEEEALWSLRRRPRDISSGITYMKHEASGKSLCWNIFLRNSMINWKKTDHVYMLLYLGSDTKKDIEYCIFEVFLQRTGEEGEKRLTGDEKKLVPQYGKECFPDGWDDAYYYNCYDCRFPWESIIRNRIALTPESTVRISVKLRIAFGAVSRPGPRVLLSAKSSTPSGAAWVASLFNKEMYSDVSIECGGKTFFAHKMVLGQSPVLARMFSTPMKESRSNKIAILDADPSTLERFLKSLYGLPYELPNDVEELLELINCAEKYDIMDIKAACFQKLAGMVSDENAAKLNIAAYCFCDSMEMKEFRDFFKNYCQERHKRLLRNMDYRRLFKENIDAFV